MRFPLSSSVDVCLMSRLEIDRAAQRVLIGVGWRVSYGDALTADTPLVVIDCCISWSVHCSL